MATYVKFNQFVEDLAHGVHDLSSDQLAVFLTTAGNDPAVTVEVLGSVTQISYTNLSTRAITTSSSAQTSGTYKLVLTDLVLTASGTVADFQTVGVYNDTPSSPADPLICKFDYGSTVSMESGDTFTVNFDDSNGLLQIA